MLAGAVLGQTCARSCVSIISLSSNRLPLMLMLGRNCITASAGPLGRAGEHGFLRLSCGERGCETTPIRFASSRLRAHSLSTIQISLFSTGMRQIFTSSRRKAAAIPSLFPSLKTRSCLGHYSPAVPRRRARCRPRAHTDHDLSMGRVARSALGDTVASRRLLEASDQLGSFECS